MSEDEQQVYKLKVAGIKFAWPWVGVALTGILGSRGANYLSDFIKKLHN